MRADTQVDPPVDGRGAGWAATPTGPGTGALIEASAEVARHLMRGGATPAEALNLLGPALLVSQHGEEGLLLLGLGERSARQRMSRIKQLIAAANALDAEEDGEEDSEGRAAWATGDPAVLSGLTRGT